MTTALAAAARVRLVRRVVAVATVSTLAYAAVLFADEVHALGAAFARLDVRALLVAIGLVLAGYLLRAARWRAYLAKSGHAPSPSRALTVFLAGLAMGVTPGKMGEAVKAHHLREREGTPYGVTLTTVLAERASDVVAMALLLAVGLAAVAPAGAALVGIGAAALVLALRSRALAHVLTVPLRGRLAPARAKALEMHGALRPLLAGGTFAWTTLLALCGWGLEVLAVHALAQGLGIELTLLEAALVFAAGSLAGVLSLLPGGLGVAEGGMVALLVLQGAALGDATALALLARLCTLWLGVAVGLVAAGHLARAKA